MSPTNKFMQLDPESKSVILSANHILLLTVRSAIVGEWTSGESSVQERTVQAECSLDEVWKGDIPESMGKRIETNLHQWQPAGPRFFKVPGVWSGQSLEPGARFVVFCGAGASSLAEWLLEPVCQQVETAEVALPDLELAALAGHPPLRLPELIARSFSRRASFDYLFAQYVSARLPELLYPRLDDFEPLTRLLEDPQLAQRARWILLTDLYSQFLLRDPAPITFVERLVASTFRILALPEGSTLRAPMIGTYIPNLVGLKGGAAPKPASQVFEGKTEDRRFATQVLATCSGVAGVERIAQWLQS